MTKTTVRPCVLCISGLDPTGGAGLSADIETCSALGAHALPLATTLTTQNSRDVIDITPVSATMLAQQARALLDDIKPSTIKIGLLGSADQIDFVRDLSHELQVPVVCDPVLKAGGGKTLVDDDLVQHLIDTLLPRITVLTPNAAEARRLGALQTLDACAAILLERGCGNVLITGGDEPGDTVSNHWYRTDFEPHRWQWEKLHGPFHGAGCTLAAAIAALLALGHPMQEALTQAQIYTRETLLTAFSPGSGRPFPNRRQFSTPVSTP